MKKIFLLVTVLFLSTGLWAQNNNAVSISADKEAIFNVINQLFDGMAKGDSNLVADVFHPLARLQSTYFEVNTGRAMLRTDPIKGFVSFIGNKPKDQQLEERILSYDIKVDDNLASVWTPYEFYLNGNFSHCGVNAFQLIRTDNGWKILQITDTRRKEPCGK